MAQKAPKGAVGPRSGPSNNQEIHEVKSTIHDFFDPAFFRYSWWNKGVVERKSRIILVGKIGEPPSSDEEEEDQEDRKSKAENSPKNTDLTQYFHSMLHRLADYCNHHTVVLLSDKAQELLCKPCNIRTLPRLFIQDESTQEWILPTAKQLESWIFTASSDELKSSFPILSHSNWVIE
jgi:hypothetical protein